MRCHPAVNLTGALPVDNLGHSIDATAGGWGTLDGFSPTSFLAVSRPSALSSFRSPILEPLEPLEPLTPRLPALGPLLLSLSDPWPLTP